MRNITAMQRDLRCAICLLTQRYGVVCNLKRVGEALGCDDGPALYARAASLERRRLIIRVRLGRAKPMRLMVVGKCQRCSSPLQRLILGSESQF